MLLILYMYMCTYNEVYSVQYLLPSLLMYEHRSPPTSQFDVIDVDPYGSPSQFMDATIQACADGGKERGREGGREGGREREREIQSSMVQVSCASHVLTWLSCVATILRPHSPNMEVSH